jgi:VWFA-related protein
MRSAPITALLILVSLSATRGQSNSSPQPGQPQAAGPVTPNPPTVPNGTDRQITLYVQVTDKSGAPVRGLQKEGFTLRDNAVPQPILSFYAVNGRPVVASDPSVEVILAVDDVNAAFRTVSYERDQIKKYLLLNGGELPQKTSLVVVTDTGARLQKDSSQDGKALAALYAQYETSLRTSTRSQGVYGAEQRTTISLNALDSIAAYEQTKPGRKLLIWISPGWPLLSGPNILLSPQDQKNFFHVVVTITTALQRAHVTLYEIDPLGIDDAASLRTSYYKSFLKGVPSPKQTQIGNLGLQVLAIQSGGAVINSTNDLATAMATCVADADSYYVLTFIPAAASKPDEYHALDVIVEKPGVTVRTRTLYYNQP